jgi:hypothetical protein
MKFIELFSSLLGMDVTEVYSVPPPFNPNNSVRGYFIVYKIELKYKLGKVTKGNPTHMDFAASDTAAPAQLRAGRVRTDGMKGKKRSS